MNRSFPGAPDGTVTQKIADFFQRELLPRADIVLDFHSGGKTLDFLPFCAGHLLADADREDQTFAAVAAFGAPWSMKMTEIDAVGMYDTAAEDMGKIFVTTELGGGGTSTAASVAIARRGVRNLLKHAGILGGAIEDAPTRWLDMPDGCFSFADEGGMIETSVDLETGAIRRCRGAHLADRPHGTRSAGGRREAFGASRGATLPRTRAARRLRLRHRHRSRVIRSEGRAPQTTTCPLM